MQDLVADVRVVELLARCPGRLLFSQRPGLEGTVRDQLDTARQLGIDKATLTAVVDRVSTANADGCRAVTAENL